MAFISVKLSTPISTSSPSAFLTAGNLPASAAAAKATAQILETQSVLGRLGNEGAADHVRRNRQNRRRQKRGHRRKRVHDHVWRKRRLGNDVSWTVTNKFVFKKSS